MGERVATPFCKHLASPKPGYRGRQDWERVATYPVNILPVPSLDTERKGGLGEGSNLLCKHLASPNPGYREEGGLGEGGNLSCKHLASPKPGYREEGGLGEGSNSIL